MTFYQTAHGEKDEVVAEGGKWEGGEMGMGMGCIDHLGILMCLLLQLYCNNMNQNIAMLGQKR